MIRKLAIAAALISISAMPALAQSTPAPQTTATAPAAPPVRIRGTVAKLDGQMLTVKSREGQGVNVTLAPNVSIVALVKRSVSDIKAGDYVASTGIKAADGKLHAVEVRIFPEALRGAGEGQYPWDLTPNSTMTNATVGTIADSPEGKVVHVTFKGGQSDYLIDQHSGVFGYVAADKSLLIPGAAVFVIAQKGADGGLTAARLTAEKDGIKPPM
jgi:hypothetical protein